MPSIEPVNILNSNCLTAGAVPGDSLDVTRIRCECGFCRASTPLEHYARRHLEVFIGPIARLAPNSLPDVKVSRPLYEVCFWVSIFGLLVAMAGSLISPIMPAGGLCLAALMWIGGWISARFFLPSQVRIGDLRTFGDLAQACCGGGEAMAFRVRAILTRWPTLTGIGNLNCGSSVPTRLQLSPEVDRLIDSVPEPLSGPQKRVYGDKFNVRSSQVAARYAYGHRGVSLNQLVVAELAMHLHVRWERRRPHATGRCEGEGGRDGPSCRARAEPSLLREHTKEMPTMFCAESKLHDIYT